MISTWQHETDNLIKQKRTDGSTVATSDHNSNNGGSEQESKKPKWVEANKK